MESTFTFQAVGKLQAVVVYFFVCLFFKRQQAARLRIVFFFKKKGSGASTDQLVVCCVQLHIQYLINECVRYLNSVMTKIRTSWSLSTETILDFYY